MLASQKKGLGPLSTAMNKKPVPPAWATGFGLKHDMHKQIA